MSMQVVPYKGHTLSTMDSHQLSRAVDAMVRDVVKRADEKDAYGRSTGTALVAQKEFDDYLEQQMALFKSKGCDPMRAYTEAIIPTGDTLPNGVKVCRIVKRGEALGITWEDDDGGDHAGVVNANRQSNTERSRVYKNRGKYNDAGRIPDEQILGAKPDIGEDTGWR